MPGLKRHLLSAHQLLYDFYGKAARLLSGPELDEALLKLRRQQANSQRSRKRLSQRTSTPDTEIPTTGIPEY